MAGTGTGFPTPKAYDAVFQNGGDRDVLITPVAGQHVVLYGAWSDSTVGGTVTNFRVLEDNTIIWIDETHAGAGIPDSLTTIREAMVFKKGVAVTVRLVGAVAGSLLVSAALVY